MASSFAAEAALAAHHALMERRRRWALHAAQAWAPGALSALGLSNYCELAPDAPAEISQRDLLLALEAAFDHGCFEAAVYGKPAIPHAICSPADALANPRAPAALA
jgi:hypothetical protein